MFSRSLRLALLLFACYGAARSEPSASLTVEDNEVDLVLGESTVVDFRVEGTVSEDAILLVELSGDTKVLDEFQTNYTLQAGVPDQSINITLVTVKEGKVTLTVTTDSDEVEVSDAFVVVSVMKDPAIDTAAMVLGWISTIAWDFSFLPQIWHNYRRNTVEGLSFDFLTFNFIGFTCYLMFNAGLYWIDPIQLAYTELVTIVKN
ncbi:PQ-loop repeat [Trinorchestia longiramus]|nr:PQ-loop repeat [Trinorchestia longiramus]